MRREPCEWCGVDAIAGTTCPRAVTCPDCSAPPGSPCKRPSGHKAMTLHMSRVLLAEQDDPPELHKEAA